MSSKEILETQKLQAEIEMLQKETEKHQAETKRHRAETQKLQSNNSSWLRENGTAVAAILTAVLGMTTFLFQQYQRHQLQVSSELIKVVNQIDSDNPRKIENAAFFLTAYKEQVVPLLLHKLNLVEPYQTTLAAESALTLIAHKKPMAVVPQLRERTELVFEAVIKGNKEKVGPLINHLRALGSMGKLGDKNMTDNVLRYFHKKLKCQTGATQTISFVEPDDRKGICTSLKKVCLELGVTGC